MLFVNSDALWDRLLFGWVKKMVGGRCRLLVVRSAPLAGNILTFMRASLGCIVSDVVVVVVIFVIVAVVENFCNIHILETKTFVTLAILTSIQTHFLQIVEGYGQTECGGCCTLAVQVSSSFLFF